MALELSNLPGCTVRSVAAEPGAPRVLEAEHAIRADDPGALEIGTAVSYTDPDWGLIFVGEVVERRRVYRDGEGIVYRCEDAYRILQKTPATIAAGPGRTAAVAFPAGTQAADALAAVLDPVAGLFPGGIGVGVSGALPETEKGGETIEEWLDEILASTPGGVAFVEPHGGSPRLVLADYYSGPSLVLTVGNYGAVNLESGAPLLAGGEAGETLAPKYRALAIEGEGIFRRRRMEYIPTTYPSDGSDEFRWYAPVRAILTPYRESGQWKDGTRAVLRIGGGGGVVIVVEDPPFVQNDGWPYFFLNVPARNAAGTFRKVEAWFDYTSWEGPLVVRAEESGGGGSGESGGEGSGGGSGDSGSGGNGSGGSGGSGSGNSGGGGGGAAGGEGERREMLTGYFVYEDGDQSVDPRPELAELAAARRTRIAGAADPRGELTVRLKGPCPDLKIGAAISNFGGMRVRRILYDVPAREISLELSDIPIREATFEAKHRRRVWRMTGTQNWRRTPRRAGRFRRKGPTWECFPGDPPYRMRDDDRGPFRSEAQARRECGDWWWFCLDPEKGQCWVSSQPAEGADGSKWSSEEDCRAACTGSGPAGFICEDGMCLEVFGEVSGAFPSYGECCANCSGCEMPSGGSGQSGASGSGQAGPQIGATLDCYPPNAAVRAILLSPRGNVVGVECLECGEIEVLTDVTCEEDGSLTKHFESIRYVKCP
ncbi:MAG: hypothetical protein N3A38_11985 [Planctomycetota bacterium]|nr:hypothetical protein [Planctomycetota bacterium]